MSEADEQVAVVDWCKWRCVPIFHIPNGGSRNKLEAVNLKRQGVKAGVPDLFLPVPSGAYHGLFIEMKFGTNKPTDNQRRWLDLLSGNGYACEVCWTADEAISRIELYLKGRL